MECCGKPSCKRNRTSRRSAAYIFRREHTPPIPPFCRFECWLFFASSHNQNTSNTRKPESFRKIFFYFSGKYQKRNFYIQPRICTPPIHRKTGRSTTRQIGPLGKIRLPCYALFIASEHSIHRYLLCLALFFGFLENTSVEIIPIQEAIIRNSHRGKLA